MSSNQRLVSRVCGLTVFIFVACAFGQFANVQDLRTKAQAGDAEAQFKLGVKYHVGEGVSQDYAEALKWFQKAADQGSPKAQCELGFMHERGHGTAVNFEKAVALYRLAAEKGEPMGQNNLGAMYILGHGVPRDQAEGVRWYRKAAEQGSSHAQMNLSRCYTESRGVTRDYAEAYAWAHLAALKNHPDARKAMEWLTLRMTQDEIAEAKRRAIAFNKGRGTVSHRTGSGFFVTEDGYFLTNYHVVRDGTRFIVRTSRQNFAAQVVAYDRLNDVALLKVNGSFRPLPLASSRFVRLGDTVFTVGFPNIDMQGVSPKLTDGKISSLTGINDGPQFFQISVAIQPGNSGGALVDARGNVVGLVTSRITETVVFQNTGSLPQNVNFAVKSAYALALLESVPDVLAKLKSPRTSKRKFEDAVKDVEQAAALVFTE